jgi:hypothetical protein
MVFDCISDFCFRKRLDPLRFILNVNRVAASSPAVVSVENLNKKSHLLMAYMAPNKLAFSRCKHRRRLTH